MHDLCSWTLWGVVPIPQLQSRPVASPVMGHWGTCPSSNKPNNVEKDSVDFRHGSLHCIYRHTAVAPTKMVSYMKSLRNVCDGLTTQNQFEYSKKTWSSAGHKFYKNDLQLGTTQDLTGVPTVLPRLPSWWEGLHSPLPKTHPTLALQALQAHQLLFSFHHLWLLSGAILISKIWLTYMLLNLNSRSTLTKYSRDN